MNFSIKTDDSSLASKANVVFLVNFLSPNLVEVMRQVAQCVQRLTVLVSVPMEANRQFQVDSSGLSVVEQKTWTRRKTVDHPGGYQEELFVHFPLDTVRQLRHIRPDCIVSLEMGTRSLLASHYRKTWNRNCRHVLSIYGSERSEAGRGRMRLWLRKFLLSRADIITFNGPSCRRYLESLGADSEKLRPWNYAADPTKSYRGPIDGNQSHKRFDANNNKLQLLTVSQLIPRKGLLPAAQALTDWARVHPDVHVHWTIAGTGPQAAELEQMTRPDNLQLELRGHCEPDQLRQLYADYPVNFFPTLGDEWGLVVDEALASGQVVIGSIYSQAVETLIHDGQNGWSYDPDQPQSLHKVLDSLASQPAIQLQSMREQARHSVANRTHIESGAQFVAAVEAALALRANDAARRT